MLFVLGFALAFFGSWCGWDFIAAKIGKVWATVCVAVAILLCVLVLPAGILAMIGLDVCGILWLTGERDKQQVKKSEYKQVTPCACYYNDKGRQIYWCPRHAENIAPRNK